MINISKADLHFETDKEESMKLKKLFKPSVILTLVVFAVIFTLAIVCSSSRIDEKLYASSGYMTSTNIALSAKVTDNDGSKIKSVTDGKSSTARIADRREGYTLTLDFGESAVFNSVIIKEDGLNVKAFALYAGDDIKNLQKIFASDKIEYHRFCSVNETEARYLKLKIIQSDEIPSIKEIEVYNEPARNSSSFRVAGYVASTWLSQAEDPANTEEQRTAAVLENMSSYKLSMLTHIFFYCGINFDENGNVFLGDSSLNDEQLQAKADALALVLECMREVCRPDVKISMVIGTNTGAPKNNPAMDTNRETFISNLINFANKFGFDGIDIDYEFPVSDYDYQVFDAFLIRLKERMLNEMNVKDSAILSCAFGTRDINYSQKAKDSLDFINVMTYDIADQDGYHSSFWGCGPQASVYYESIGVDRSKINLGIPFYGTQIHALMEQYSYADIENPNYYSNIYYCDGYTYGIPTPVYFNSPAMVRDKTSYALLSGMGGIMVWHTAADVEYENEFSLWRAVEKALDVYGGEN